MERKYKFAIVVVLLLALFAERWCWYNLPVELPLLEQVNEECHVKVLPFYKGLKQDKDMHILTGEEILELKGYLENSTFSHLHKKDKIRKDSDTTYHITITWGDGRFVQLRTFGENSYDSDVLAWDTGKIQLLQAHDENWHENLEKIITE